MKYILFTFTFAASVCAAPVLFAGSGLMDDLIKPYDDTLIELPGETNRKPSVSRSAQLVDDSATDTWGARNEESSSSGKKASSSTSTGSSSSPTSTKSGSSSSSSLDEIKKLHGRRGLHPVFGALPGREERKVGIRLRPGHVRSRFQTVPKQLPVQRHELPAQQDPPGI